MRYRVMTLALAAGCFSTPVTPAQSNPPPVPNDRYSVALTDSGTVADPKAMWEDVEIFRRILDRAVTPWAEKSNAAENLASFAFSPDELHLAEAGKNGMARFGQPNLETLALWGLKGARRSPVEGNYLKGYGVVFTATLPWDGRHPVAQPPTSEPKPPSEWDRVRKEIRGEKVEPTPSKGHAGPSLADIVLKVLADNGRHFSQLGENERVTVALTLRPDAPADRDSVWLDLLIPGPKGENRKALARDPETGNFYAPALPDLAEIYLLDKRPEAGNAARTQAANMVHLGDQRLKQERLQEAADSYHAAVTGYTEIVEKKYKAGVPPRELMDDLGALTVARSKLANVYFGLKRDQEARQLLAQVARDYEFITGKPTPPPTATPAKRTRTGKLIISAPKRSLDQVGTGKLSLEEFKKQASLDFYSWDAPGKEPAKSADGKVIAPVQAKP